MVCKVRKIFGRKIVVELMISFGVCSGVNFVGSEKALVAIFPGPLRILFFKTEISILKLYCNYEIRAINTFE